jgi:hypothetical protein
MKNDHLIPVNVKDIISRLGDNGLTPNERLVLIQRLEAIQQYCSDALKKYNYVDLGQVYTGRK